MKRPLPFHSNAVWPPAFPASCFLFLYGFLALSFWVIEALTPQADGSFSSREEFTNVWSSVLILAAGTYAVFRIWRFHPACNHAYAAWLKLSPWTAERPLPLGPVHPVWQDAVVAGVFAFLAFAHAHINPLVPVMASGFVYLVGMTGVIAYTRMFASLTALLFLWPAMLLPALEGWPVALLVVGILVVIWHGYKKGLSAFPWAFLESSSRSNASVLTVQIKVRNPVEPSSESPTASVAWPLSVLSPKLRCYSISTVNSLIVSAVIAWWAFCLIMRFEIQLSSGAILSMTIFAAAIRLTFYCYGITTPFNFFGRIASGNIIIPGFDKILLTPFAAVLVAIAGGVIIRRSGSYHALVEALVIAVICSVLLIGGPRLRDWNLTGRHRFRTPSRATANKQKLRQV